MFFFIPGLLQKPSQSCHWKLHFSVCRQRSGRIRVLSFKIGIILMCKAALEDKYRCKFSNQNIIIFSKQISTARCGARNTETRTIRHAGVVRMCHGSFCSRSKYLLFICPKKHRQGSPLRSVLQGNRQEKIWLIRFSL